MSSDLKIAQRPAGQAIAGGEQPQAKAKPKETTAQVYRPPQRTLKFVRGPETAKALALDTPKRSFLDFAVSALSGRESSDAALDKRIKEIERQYVSAHNVEAMTKEYISIAARAGDDTKHTNWLAYFPFKLLQVRGEQPDTLLIAWLPYLGGNDREFLSHVFKRLDEPSTAEVGRALLGAYFHYAQSNRELFASRLSMASQQFWRPERVQELIDEARTLFVESTKLSDEKDVFATFQQLSHHPDFALDPAWLEAALSGASSEELMKRTSQASSYYRADIREAAKALLSRHLLEDDITQQELYARLLRLDQQRHSNHHELSKAAAERLRALTDWTKPEEVGAIAYKAPPVKSAEVIEELEAAGFDLSAMKAYAIALFHHTTMAREMFTELAKREAAIDPLTFARATLERAKALQDARTAEGGLLHAAFPVLLEYVAPERLELCDAVAELAKTLHVAIPKTHSDRFFGSDPDVDLARAIERVNKRDHQLTEPALRTIGRLLSAESAPAFDVLAERLSTVVERAMPAAKDVVKTAFARLASLVDPASPEQRERAAKLADAISAATIAAHDQSFRIPKEHIPAIYRRTDTEQQAFDRAVAALDRTKTRAAEEARIYLSSVLNVQHTDPALLTRRLKQVMDRIGALAEAAKKEANSIWKRLGGSRAQAAGNTARTELDQMVRELVKPSYDQLLELADYTDDRQALFLALAPEPLLKENIKAIEFPPAKSDLIFRIGRPLPRAVELLTHSIVPLRTQALQIANDPARKNDLFDALVLHYAKPSRLAHHEVDALFSVENVEAMLEEQPLNVSELGRRMQLVAKDFLAQTKWKREVKVIDAIQTAYDRLLPLVDLTDREAVRELLELPAAFHEAEKKVTISAAQARAIFAGGTIDRTRALELLGHPAESIRAEAARLLEKEFDGAPDAVLKEMRARLDALQPAAAAPVNYSKETWARGIREGLDGVESEPMQAMHRMRERFLAELEKQDDKSAALKRLFEVFGASHERDRAVDRIVGEPRWISTDVLKTAELDYRSGQFDRDAGEMFVKAIGTFLGDPSKLIECFEGRRPPSSIGAELSDDAAEGTRIASRLRDSWKTLDPSLKPVILERAFADLFEAGKKQDVQDELKKRGLQSPEEALKTALRTHALEELEKDPEARSLSPKIEKLFDALPEVTKSKMISALLLEPPTNDSAVLIRRLLVAAGVVAIKAGQQMCEDPEVPKRFRDELENLRDQNERMTVVAMWRQVPDELRGEISKVGRTLGTGSVKQVFELERTNGEAALGAVLREGVEQQIKDTIGALRVLDDTKHLVDRLEPMLAREVDLLLEAKAFDALRETPVGKSPLTIVPQVIAAHKRALIREPAPGEPLSAILRTRPLDQGEKKRLMEVHRLLIKSALDTSPPWLGSWAHRKSGPGTFVLTDPHQGNIADDGKVLGLFDPGQYENLTAREAELFVRLLVAFSKPNWQRRKRPGLVRDLAALCNTTPAKIDAAYEETFREPNATVGRKLQLLLLAASKDDVTIPNGYFGLAKMLHSLQSQEAELGMPDVVKSVIKDLYLDQLGPVGRVYRATSSEKS